MNCFKAYDIRGKVPEDLNEEIAYAIGCAFVEEFEAMSVVVGQDIREESPLIAGALMRGLCDAGCDVIDIGLCGTEEVYFAVPHYQACGGIMVTASHNPKGYNGMKLVRRGSVPVSGDSGLDAMRERVVSGSYSASTKKGQRISKPDKSAYINHLLSYVDMEKLRPLSLVVNPGNGVAGPVVEKLREHLPFTFHMVQAEPDGSFPFGVPNPLLPENRIKTTEAVIAHQADMGIAWDGDFDRCFFFDKNGRFIEGYYLVGLLAEMMLAKNPGEKIIYDPRLYWSTVEQVSHAGGVPVQSKTGHAFIKERMRKENAVYGGEMSAHHYFREFAYCDSGMIPWLLIAEMICQTGMGLDELVNARIERFPCSGEINYRVSDVSYTIQRVLKHFETLASHIDFTDGISVEFSDWRFNLRGSNTEPLLRLNVESHGDANLVQRKVAEIEKLLAPDIVK